MIQTKKMAELLQQYWSVEIFWFPFNSIVDRILSILPLVKGSGDNPNKIPEVSELRLSAESVFASGLGDFVRLSNLCCNELFFLL